MATKRRRFTAEFKARVAMEALRGDRRIQEIAAKHEVHPTQVSGWKRQAQEGLRGVFASGANRQQADQETVIHDLHAKIGELIIRPGSKLRFRRLVVGGHIIGQAIKQEDFRDRSPARASPVLADSPGDPS